MEVRVLGTGCPKCKRLEELARMAVAEADVEATVTKVTSLQDIMSYPIVSTPALVIDGQVKSSGRIPRKEEILAWLSESE